LGGWVLRNVGARAGINTLSHCTLSDSLSPRLFSLPSLRV
jgi:hypothetical protein